MERWILIGGVVAIFLGLAAMGWHFQQNDNMERMCTSAEAQCGERRL
jgi:outer membrane lipopolysaccharide assembly protein LptE/RlpB